MRYEDLFAAQPFYNNLVTLTLTGAQLLQVLEQQWLTRRSPRILQVSRGFSYRWDAAQPAGQRVVPGSVPLDGQPIAPDSAATGHREQLPRRRRRQLHRLQTGHATRSTGMMDVDALEQYVAASPTSRPARWTASARLN